MSCLFVLPLQINAFYTDKPKQVIGQDIVFENIPWFNKDRDIFINPNTPFLTKSIIPRPFSYDNAVYLEKGLHLHWNIPSLLKTINKTGTLPQAPNRWYVKREHNDEKMEWVIESDYVWGMDEDALDRLSTCTFPQGDKNKLGNAYEFAYVGRKYLLNEWINSSYRKDRYLDDFTAMGWGTLSFDLHYANCRSLFGLYDTDIDGSQDAIYTVVGWYDDVEKDFIQLKVAANQKELSAYIQSLKKSRESWDFNDGEFLNYIKARPLIDIEPLKAYIAHQSVFDRNDLDQFMMTQQLNVYDWHVDVKASLTEIKSSNVRTLVFGQYRFEKGNVNETTPDSGDIAIAIGNTLPEALSSLILADYSGDEVELLKKEEQIEAILNFDALNTLKLDWVARLRNKRHENQFNIKTGTTSWELRKNEDSQPVSATIALQKSLNELNRNQPKLDLAKYRLYSAVEKLYLDWYKYVEMLFERKDVDYAISLDELKIHIERASLAQVNASEKVVADLEKTVSTLKQDVLSQLQLEGLADSLQLALRDSTNYYEPLPPGVVISSEADNTALDIFSVMDRKSAYLISDDFSPFTAAKSELGERISRLQKRILRQCTIPTNSGTNSWRTYKVEWEVLFMPNKNGHYLSDDKAKFGADFITDTYVLDEQNADLIKTYDLQNIAYHNKSNSYYGSSFVDNRVKNFVQNKVQDYLQNTVEQENPLRQDIVAFSEKLETTKLFELTLNDFNNAMVQRSSALSLMPYVPNGFESHQTLAEEIKIVIERYKDEIKLLNPNESAVFNPFRNGAFTIKRLRLIDCFGRNRDIAPKAVYMPAKQKIDYKPDWIQLPPRIAQPAAISVRWEDTLTQLDKTNREYAPVLGWLIPVYLMQRIEFFDAWGKHVGAFNSNGEWEFSPFDGLPVGAAFDESFSFIGNEDLRKILVWFRKQLDHSKRSASKAFMAEFINQVTLAFEHIEPELYQNPSLLETIATLPIAITKININLYTKGDPVFDLSWENFSGEVGGSTPKNTRNYTAVEIPIQLGDITQYNDGVIAYWHDQDITKSKSSVYFNNSIAIPQMANAKAAKESFHDLQTFLAAPEQAEALASLQEVLRGEESATDARFLLKNISSIPFPKGVIKNKKTLTAQNLRENRETIKSVFGTIKKLIADQNDVNPVLEQFQEHDITTVLNFFNRNNRMPAPLRRFMIKNGLKIDQLPAVFADKKYWLGKTELSPENFLKSIIADDGFTIHKSDFLRKYLANGTHYFNLLVKNKLIARPAVRHTAISFIEKDKHAKVAINESTGARTFMVLMHPKSSLFVKSGILPIKELKLPYDKIKNALRQIELTLLTAPILTPKDQLQLSLLKDKRYEWSWLEVSKAEKGKALSTENLPIKKRITQNRAINLDTLKNATLKSKLLDSVFLDSTPFYPREEIYFFNEEKIDEFEQLLAQSKESNHVSIAPSMLEAYQLLMSQCDAFLQIEDFKVSTADIPGLMLKEGWLSIKSTQF